MAKRPCKLKKLKKSKKTLEVRGVGQVSNWKFKKIGKYIFIHYFITFLCEHSNINTGNVINVLLCICSCFYVHVQVFVVNDF